jgi:mannosyl-3-phosphoglycerate phosphatase
LRRTGTVWKLAAMSSHRATSVVVFSDLDGTLLDHETYSFDAASPALERLREHGIPLVLCTSKTRAEIAPLRRALGNTHPFISENGGAVFIPAGYFPFALSGAERRDDLDVIAIGDSYADLVTALSRASRSAGVAVRGFADMTDADVAAATGLSLEEAHLARQREFDEPFEILDADRADDLCAAIEREGKRWTAGGRFHHIMGASDKAAAVRFLTTLYRRRLGAVTTVGLGDAPNDASFLAEVDIPVAIASPRVDQLLALVPAARPTRLPGPAGWNEAVLEIIGNRQSGVGNHGR